VSDRFRESRTEIVNVRTAFSKAGRKFTMSGPLWQKLSRNWKSQTEFEKVVQHCEKSDGNWKFQTEILKVRPHFGFPSDFFQSCPEFEKVRQL
jgi:hypothetical protein